MYAQRHGEAHASRSGRISGTEAADTSQEVGWELGNGVPGDTSLCEAGKHPFHLRTSATTQFQDAQEKHTWGRSIGGEFSLYASRKLLEFGGFGIGI